MSTIFHTAIATGAAANASVINAPLAQLDAGIGNQAAAITALQNAVLLGGTAVTQANGAANAGQKVVTVDDATVFVGGCAVEYQLVGGVLERNIVATVDSPTQITLTTNIGTGGIANNAMIAVIPIGFYNATRGLFNVRDCGAAGDGVTDDAAVIQATIAVCQAIGGGVVYFPAGTYYLATGLTVTSSNVRLIGQGETLSALDYHGATYGVTISCGTNTLSGVACRDLGVTCQYTGTTAGIFVTGSGGGGLVDSVFERLAIADCGNAGLWSAAGCAFSRNRVQYIVTTHCGDFGVHFSDALDCTITDIMVDGLASVHYPAHGVYLKGVAKRNKVLRNTVKNCLGTNSFGIEVSGDTGTAESNIVADNVILNSRGGIQVYHSSNHQIHGNKVISDNASGVTGIQAYGTNAGVGIIGNTVTGMSEYGIRVLGLVGNTCADVDISGSNIINDCALGVSIEYADKVIFSDNVVDPVEVASSGVSSVLLNNVGTAIVDANTITCAARGIMASNTTSLLIAHNQILNNASDDATYSIRVTSTCVRAVIADNDVTDAVGATFENSATTAINHHNPGVTNGPTYASTVYGSSAANGDLMLEGTSHATKTTSNVAVQTTGGQVVVGANAPVSAQKLELVGSLRVWDSASLGSELVTNGGFASATTGWTATDATLASVAGGQSGNCLEITNTGGAYGNAWQVVATVPNVLYCLTRYHKNGSISGTTRIGTSAGGAQIYDDNGVSDANWTLATIYFMATTATTYITLQLPTTSAGATTLFDEVSVKAVTGGDVLAGGDVIAGAGKVLAAEGLGVGNSAAATTLGSVAKKIEVFDAAGTNLGYLAIYDAIT